MGITSRHPLVFMSKSMLHLIERSAVIDEERCKVVTEIVKAEMIER